ncbi:sugar ABC transporter substrate-binding protein [Streptomyces zingiberis]|uniref:Substrate-binding domain-containing protein n=1 Tax=Streptomyces zingiberis TaxID=2053010 RepID=A0ABX1BSX2_9ACTN|nr:substrate-binding domain-containing protein [Streptomyces zingiberis]NJQ00188.1 substrate-binding domain-containing protein [Streptomyces zingiberis]
MKKTQATLTVLAMAAALTACGSGGEDGKPSAGEATSAEVLASARKVTAANLAGTDRELPADGPKAQKGKKVWAIACSTVAPGCSMPAEGLAEAGKVLGWKTTIADGKLDPSVYNAQIRAAAAANADALVLFGIDCAPVKGAIQAAQKSGTKVFGANALDCDDKYAVGGGTALFDGELVWGPDDADYAAFTDTYVGPGQADWVIAKTKGKADIVQLRQDDSAGTRHIGESAHERFKDCGGCTVTTVSYTGADLAAGKLQGKVSAALQKAPRANVVTVPVDAAISLGVASAVQQARAGGREILLVGQEGVPASVKLIKSGTQSFALGRPWRWTGWAAADGVNRMFAGEKAVDAGFGFGSMDAGHLPKSDVYDGNDPSTPYVDNYRRIWTGRR